MASAVVSTIGLIASEQGRRKQIKMSESREKKAQFMQAQQEDKANKMKQAQIKAGSREAKIKNKRLKAYTTKQQSLLAPANDMQLGV